MYIKRKIHFRIVWSFAWFNLIVFSLISLGAVLIYECTECPWVAIPFLPVSLLGTATAFYIGFKNNSSYDRLWEARRIWGSIVNDSRSWAICVREYLGNHNESNSLSPSEIDVRKKKLVYRQIAFINALRVQLRRQQTWEHGKWYNKRYRETMGRKFGPVNMQESIEEFLSKEEMENALKSQNVALHIMSEQSRELEKMRSQKLMDEFRYVDLQKIIQNMINNQGGCERIKNFPFPRQYAFFSGVFVWIFIVLLPFSLLKSFGEMGDNFVWMVIPFSVLTSWFLMTMELVGDYSENPFETLINDVPLSAMCRNIEIDLREILGETELPPRIVAYDDVLL